MPGLLDIPPIVPRGWEIADIIPSTMGAIVSLAANVGVGSVAPTQITAFTIPNGVKVLLDRLACRMVDAGGDDQVNFILRHNGIPVRPFELISGTVFTYTKELTALLTFTPGLLELVGQNTNAGAAFRVQAYFFGWILRKIRGE